MGRFKGVCRLRMAEARRKIKEQAMLARAVRRVERWGRLEARRKARENKLKQAVETEAACVRALPDSPEYKGYEKRVKRILTRRGRTI